MSKETTNTVEEKEALKITIDPMDFSKRATSRGDFMTSFDICDITNSIFKSVFDDYEGCTFEVVQDTRRGGMPTPIVNLFFNHRDYSDDAVRAFTANIEDENCKNDTLRRVQRQQRIFKQGNKYNITEDGKSAIEEFVSSMFRNNNNKVNWNACAMDVAQPNNNREVLSKVCGIDINKILAAVYGSKDLDNVAEFEYDVQIKQTLATPIMGQSGGYLLHVNQINKVQLDRALRDAGIVNPNGLGIVK